MDRKERVRQIVRDLAQVRHEREARERSLASQRHRHAAHGPPRRSSSGEALTTSERRDKNRLAQLARQLAEELRKVRAEREQRPRKNVLPDVSRDGVKQAFEELRQVRRARQLQHGPRQQPQQQVRPAFQPSLQSALRRNQRKNTCLF